MKNSKLFLGILFILFQASILAQETNVVLPQKEAQPIEVKIEPKSEFETASIGLGLGLDYGGIGVNVLVYPQKNIGFFVGGGSNFIGFGYNVGAKFRFAKENFKGKMIPYLIGMYGYNTAIAIQNVSSLNKVFYGPTVGFGIDYCSKRSRGNYWSFGILVPIRGNEVDNYLNDLEQNKGVKFDSKPLPIAITIGYRIAL